MHPGNLLRKKLGIAGRVFKQELPWLATGSDTNAPRSTGPTPRAPTQAPGMIDRGGPWAPKPILGVPEMDRDRVDTRHSPESALHQLQDMVRAAHRKP